MPATTDGAIELFYSYAHDDENLRDQLNDHLALLQHQGFITAWYDRDISAGSLRAEEIDKHLETAQIILLLVSSSFLASKYCYGAEVQKALARHKAGAATVIPIILRPCDWETAPFGELHALPKNAKPIISWSKRDTAFTDVAKGIRKVVETLHRNSPMEPSAIIKKKKNAHPGTGMGEKKMESVRAIGSSALKSAINRYHKELDEFKGKVEYELAIRSAFQNLLAEAARQVKWTLIPEQTLEGGIRPDGVLRDEYFPRGYWEAKGPNSDLDKEIAKKIASGYPLTNTIFENSKRAILYQNKKRSPIEYDLQQFNDVSDLLKQFFAYTKPDVENFETAVQEFKERIPEHAKKLLEVIEQEYKLNKKFITAFDTFTDLCRTSLDPRITTDVIKEMLIQHLLTERLFRTIFDNSDFVNRNVIASEIEKVIRALASRSFNRHEFLQPLDRFYVAIEAAARDIESWTERQHFMNTVYERFFQGYSVKRADTYGIVYTPQEIVDFMCESVNEVLKREFDTSIEEPGVKIIDPCVGTGSFIVNLLHRIPSYKLKEKYRNDFFCNEIMLLPYYIASLNIEHEYYTKIRDYEPFEGICFVDTLELTESRQLPLFLVEENTERVKREKEAQITVVIGNPPYNVGQKSENDNNKNRKYPVIDEHVYDTYAKRSKATNTRALSDAYVKFFRWATDRLQGQDGVVCLISNNSFITGYAFDGFRARLEQEFTSIYHLDLGGNARKREGGNVFDIMVGVGITMLVISRKEAQSLSQPASIFYYRVADNQSGMIKLNFLATKVTMNNIEWQELHPDENHTWITEGLYPEFSLPSFLLIGTKEAKATPLLEISGVEVNTIFKTYSRGAETTRDSWMYDFNVDQLASKSQSMIETYNAERSRWLRAESPKDVDSFVLADETKIKWSSRLKECLVRNIEAKFDVKAIRNALYRPFTKQFLYFDNIMTHRQGLFPLVFPTPDSELENIMICVPGPGDRKGFGCLATNLIANLDLAFEKVQCFPYYTYSPDGSNRRENITDWALSQFQAKYGPEVSKWDIFHYVYGMLHHPQYRERYAENLKRDLPHIPLLHSKEAFQVCVRIGKQLMEMHLNYEQAKEYKKLEWLLSEDVPFSWRVEKMRLAADKSVVVVNESLRLGPLPPEVFEYRLGNRSALEWVIDQYQVSQDKRSGIESDPNRLDDEEYIVRLVGRVVTVSVETVKLVKELALAVTMEDWMEETVNPGEAVVETMEP